MKMNNINEMDKYELGSALQDKGFYDLATRSRDGEFHDEDGLHDAGTEALVAELTRLGGPEADEFIAALKDAMSDNPNAADGGAPGAEEGVGGATGSEDWADLKDQDRL